MTRSVSRDPGWWLDSARGAADPPPACGVEQAFHASIAAELRASPDGAERFRVFTPFRFDDGDHLVIVLKKDGSGWILSDEAHTLMHLAEDGGGPGAAEGAHGKIVSGILSKFGVADRGGELAISVREGRCGDAFYTFVQALIEIQAATRVDPRPDVAAGLRGPAEVGKI